MKEIIIYYPGWNDVALILGNEAFINSLIVGASEHDDSVMVFIGVV